MAKVCQGGLEKIPPSFLDGTGRAESCHGDGEDGGALLFAGRCAMEEPNLLLPFDGSLLQSILLQSPQRLFSRAFV